MDFTIDTGDSADNQQLQRDRLGADPARGRHAQPQQRRRPDDYSNPLCPQRCCVPGAAEAARYTGVQDYDDYVEGTIPDSTTRTSPRGAARRLAQYPGLMDRAQQPFTAAGLEVPSYVAFGNHDGLVQGNQAANAAFEEVATGCMKPIGPVPTPKTRRRC